jgi:hypothetical protein
VIAAVFYSPRKPSEVVAIHDIRAHPGGLTFQEGSQSRSIRDGGRCETADAVETDESIVTADRHGEEAMTKPLTHEATPHPLHAPTRVAAMRAAALDFEIDIAPVAADLARDVEALPRRAPLFALMGAMVLADAVILGALALTSGCADPSVDQYALEAENTGGIFSTDTDAPADTTDATDGTDGTDCDCPCDEDGEHEGDAGKGHRHGRLGHRPPPPCDPAGDTEGDTDGEPRRCPPPPHHPPFAETDGDDTDAIDANDDTGRLPPPRRCHCGPPRDGDEQPRGPRPPHGPRPGDTDDTSDASDTADTDALGIVN